MDKRTLEIVNIWMINSCCKCNLRWFEGVVCRKMNCQKEHKGFPGGAVVESLPANAGDMGSSPGLGRSHMPRSN